MGTLGFNPHFVLRGPRSWDVPQLAPDSGVKSGKNLGKALVNEVAHIYSYKTHTTSVSLIRDTIQWTTRITETGITNLTRITNEIAAASDYLMEYFNGILAVLLE